MKKLTFALLGLMMFAACQKKEATIHITVKERWIRYPFILQMRTPFLRWMRKAKHR